MELPTLFAIIDANGEITIENFCFVRNRRLNAARYNSRRRFIVSVNNINDMNGQTGHNVFGLALLNVPVGRLAFCTLSLQNTQNLGHCIAVTFYRRSAQSVMTVEVVDIRGSQWGTLSGYYRSIQSLYVAVESVLNKFNIQYRLVPMLRHERYRYMVPGSEYAERWDDYDNGLRVVNCRTAALSYIWIRSRLVRNGVTRRGTAYALLMRSLR